MAVDERRWVDLYERLSAALGPEAATTLSELLPPRGADVATRGDVTALRGDLLSEFTRGRESMVVEFARLREERAAELAQLRTEMGSMEHRLTALFERRISDAVTAQTRTLVLSQLAALLAIAALAFGLR
jgi:hypothetical protein